MKVKVISRIEEEYTRETKSEAIKVHRNLDPRLRPMHRATEYKRALNATKLDKVFAKPFCGAFEGHSDGILSLAKNTQNLKQMASGAADGEIRVWDCPSRKALRILNSHSGAIRGLSFDRTGGKLVSCSDDRSIRIWNVPEAELGELGSRETRREERPAMVVAGESAYRDVDCHWGKDMFATAGNCVDLWDMNKDAPVSSFEWGCDTVLSVRFNPAEPEIFASCGSDRSIALYDCRTNTPTRKLIMQNKCTKLCWNPMEAFNFTVANEDCNLYSYDMRKLNVSTCVHKDFVSAVLDVDYSPTGREFVAGSYDKSIRLFDFNSGHSRDCYHTKRMQRVFCVKFSMDGTYVFSGSDDFNVRLWKAHASEKVGTLLPREKRKMQYNDALKDRFKHMPEIRRIANHKHVPKSIHKSAKLRRTMTDAQTRKKERRVAHAAPGAHKKEFKPMRKERIVEELE